MTEEQEAAINFIRNCRVLYPDVNMMDEDTRRMYNQCWQIFSQKTSVQKIDENTKKQILKNNTRRRQ